MTMTSGQTQEVLMAYAQALLGQGDYGQYMSEGVAYTLMNSGRVVRGRETVVRAIGTDHASAREIRIRNVLAGAGQATVEAEFVGSEGTVLPYTIAYDFADGRIAALRVYFAGDIPG